ncbi:MAG: hypothetical protein ABS44_09380 [Chryseobacterium sp. SCN 40-13]|nr:MAG: hypothetical protein ABS44_09380 [Chryseobacterium sp. SCN 40-13]
MKILLLKIFLILFPLVSLFGSAQQKEITGKIINSENGEALPYAKVYVTYVDGSKRSVSTDFDGFYSIPYDTVPDSLAVSLEGFEGKSFFIREDFHPEHHVTLQRKVAQNKNTKKAERTRERQIDEVVITKKKKKYKNPAFEIMEKVIERKPNNNPEKFDSYSYENYNRMEISISNFGKKMEKRKVVRDIKAIMETAKEVAGEDGKPLLPVFISENLSDYYYQKSPHQSTEIIKKTKIEGIGIEDGSMFTQLTSSTFVKYNFYNNNIRILGKDFVSPINDTYKLLYDYELVSKNHEIDGERYYLLNFKPKRESDLAFMGSMLINHGTYSLFRIDAEIMPTANINFIHSLKIQQEMMRLPEEDNWLPGKTRVFLETARPGKESVAVFLKYYSSIKDPVINQPINKEVFEKEIVVLENATTEDEAYWEQNRHSTMTAAEKKMYGMIKEVKNLPSLRTYLDVIEVLLNGYYKVGNISIGPYLYTLGYNDVEGLRLRAGFKTNQHFSKKWIFGGYLSYGFKDEKLKYGVHADYIISREPWIQAGVNYAHDLGQVAFQYEDFSVRMNNIFNAFTKNGKMSVRRPFWEDQYQAYFKMDVLNSLTQKITFKHATFDPLFDFAYHDPEQGIMNDYKTSELIAETVWRPGRRILQRANNTQLNLKDNIYNPLVTFRYHRGIKGVLDSDFDYNKFTLNVQQTVPMGILGRGEYSLTGGYIPGQLPYPLLENHLGNDFMFYNKYAFNMMRFFEFTSNRYASFQYIQNLEGLITNSLPLIKKLHWRNHVTFNYLIGSLDPKMMAGNSIGQNYFQGLQGKPYMEVGYGVSNIFRFLRVDFIHRLTHLNPLPDGRVPPKFGVTLSAHIKL